jgi:hypothetical protein
MRRTMSILTAAALALGLSGTAMAQEYRHGDPAYGYGTGDRAYERDRGFYGRGYGYGTRDGERFGRGDAVAPWMRMRIREARMDLRRAEWRAWRDGVVTRWERMEIRHARMRLAWLVHRAYGGGGTGSW